MINSIIITDLRTAESASSQSNIEQKAWMCVIERSNALRAEAMQHNHQQHGRPCHVEYMYDYWEGQSNAGLDVIDIPSQQHINSIVDFLKPLIASDEPVDLGINCYQGMCRSTAAGYIAWILQGKSPKQALDAIIKVRSIAIPNLRMVQLAKPHIGADAVDHMLNWHARMMI